MRVENWFSEWFDSPYYHRLYQNRDEAEAEAFIAHLLEYLKLSTSAHILDLACGKGRHARTIHKHGYRVTGVDLSPNSIAEAAANSAEKLDFYVHDMRQVIPGSSFDAVFNLFTSFGYFDSMEENHQVLSAIREMTKADGILVIDFLNAKRVIEELVETEIVQRDGLSFAITRQYNGTHIYKGISFTDEGKDFRFIERVQALGYEDFRTLLVENGFEIIHTFGDYQLHYFDADRSGRLILIAKKKND